MTAAELEHRYPRLLRAVHAQGILSRSEATSAVAAYRRGQWDATEAVAHYGGARRLIADAIRNRARAR